MLSLHKMLMFMSQKTTKKFHFNRPNICANPCLTPPSNLFMYVRKYIYFILPFLTVCMFDVLRRNGAQKSVQLKVQWPSMPTVLTVQSILLLVSSLHIDHCTAIFDSLVGILKLIQVCSSTDGLNSKFYYLCAFQLCMVLMQWRRIVTGCLVCGECICCSTLRKDTFSNRE